MAKLKAEEIIDFYKKDLLSKSEIQAESGYFSSPYQIEKVLEEARRSGKITPEDDLRNQEEQERKKEEKQRQKEESKQKMRELVVAKYRGYKSAETIAGEIEVKGRHYSRTTIREILKEAISEGLLTQEEYDEIGIKNKKRSNAADASKKKEGPTL